MKLILITLLSILLVGCTTSDIFYTNLSTENKALLKPFDKTNFTLAEDVATTDSSFEEITVTDIKDVALNYHYTLVMFYATWCKPQRTMVKHMSSYIKALKNPNVKPIFVSYTYDINNIKQIRKHYYQRAKYILNAEKYGNRLSKKPILFVKEMIGDNYNKKNRYDGIFVLDKGGNVIFSSADSLPKAKLDSIFNFH